MLTYVLSKDIEDICIAAVKEKDIEAKLKQVIAEWSVQDLTFSGKKYVTRLLKICGYKRLTVLRKINELTLKLVLSLCCKFLNSILGTEFKTRGELLLKAGDIMEIVALMEDSLMVLSSLMSNR